VVAAKKQLADGLRVITCDADTNAMCSVVHKVKNLVMYFDPDDTFGGVALDDMVVNPVSELPKVISPMKVQVLDQRAEKLPVFYRDLRKNDDTDSIHGEVNASGSDEDNEDPDYFTDTDNDVEEGDDDLFDNIIDDDGDQLAKMTKAKKARGSRLKGERVVVTVDDTDDLSSEDDQVL
jgi:hypothetical protein